MGIDNSVRAKRVSKRITIQELSTAAQIGIATISDIERGIVIPRVDTALMICRALQCTVEEADLIKSFEHDGALMA